MKPPCVVSLMEPQLHNTLAEVSPIFQQYTEYAGLGFPVILYVALGMCKPEMLVPVKHCCLWGKSCFSALLCVRGCSLKIDTPILLFGA